MHIHLNDHITINASAKKVWRVLAHDFGDIGHWASAIPASKAVANLLIPEGLRLEGEFVLQQYRALVIYRKALYLMMNNP